MTTSRPSNGKDIEFGEEHVRLAQAPKPTFRVIDNSPPKTLVQLAAYEPRSLQSKLTHSEWGDLRGFAQQAEWLSDLLERIGATSESESVRRLGEKIRLQLPYDYRKQP